MEKLSFEAGIADLEKADATPVLQIANAARLIGVDLEQNIEQSSHAVRYKCDSGSCGFKEQWLLRWLLKKLSFHTSKENGDEVWTAETR